MKFIALLPTRAPQTRVGNSGNVCSRSLVHQSSYLPPAEPAPAPDPDEPLVPAPVPSPLEPGVPVPLLPGVPIPLLGVLFGELMSGVPGVGGTPGVAGLPICEPLLGVLMVDELLPVPLPGAPALLAPKCEFTCWLQVESIVGQLPEVKVGALCSLA